MEKARAKQADDSVFDGGWAWMAHPERNDGNAIPVKMKVVDGVRYYIPLDPTGATEFEWDRRDDEWQIVVPPIAAVISDVEMPEAAAHIYPSDLERFQECETFGHAYSVAVVNPSERSVPLYTAEQVQEFARAAIAKATGSNHGSR